MKIQAFVMSGLAAFALWTASGDAVGQDAPAGWTLDREYEAMGSLRYRHDGGAVVIETTSRPPTDATAAAWLEAYIVKTYRGGRLVERSSVDDAPALAAGRGDGATGAKVRLTRKRYGKEETDSFIMAAVAEPGQPLVMTSMMVAEGETPPADIMAAFDAIAGGGAADPVDPDEAGRLALKSIGVDDVEATLKSNAEKTVRTLKKEAAAQERAAAKNRERAERAAKKAAYFDAITLDEGETKKQPAVDDVLITWRMAYSGTFANMTYSAHALFDDGWAYRSPAVPLERLDVAGSREAEPDKWRRWRRDGDGYAFQSDDGAWSASDSVSGTAEPAKPSKRFSGLYEYYRTSGNMMSSSVSTGRFRLKDDGTYTDSSSSMTDSSGFGAGSVYTARSCGPDGGGSAVSISNGGLAGGGSSDNPACGDGKSGTYTVEGYTITLNANDGRVHERPFYAVGDGLIMIGTTGYNRAKG